MKLKLDENLGAAAGAVLRLPPRLSHGHLLDACAILAAALKQSDVTGKTWIVEIGRIREYRPDREPGDN